MSASVGGYVDHVHLLVGLSRTVTIAKLVEQMKAETSKGYRRPLNVLVAGRLRGIFREPFDT